MRISLTPPPTGVWPKLPLATRVRRFAISFRGASVFQTLVPLVDDECECNFESYLLMLQMSSTRMKFRFRPGASGWRGTLVPRRGSGPRSTARHRSELRARDRDPKRQSTANLTMLAVGIAVPPESEAISSSLDQFAVFARALRSRYSMHVDRAAGTKE